MMIAWTPDLTIAQILIRGQERVFADGLPGVVDIDRDLFAQLIASLCQSVGLSSPGPAIMFRGRAICKESLIRPNRGANMLGCPIHLRPE